MFYIVRMIFRLILTEPLRLRATSRCRCPGCRSGSTWTTACRPSRRRRSWTRATLGSARFAGSISAPRKRWQSGGFPTSSSSTWSGKAALNVLTYYIFISIPVSVLLYQKKHKIFDFSEMNDVIWKPWEQLVKNWVISKEKILKMAFLKLKVKKFITSACLSVDIGDTWASGSSTSLQKEQPNSSENFNSTHFHTLASMPLEASCYGDRNRKELLISFEWSDRWSGRFCAGHWTIP